MGLILPNGSDPPPPGALKNGLWFHRRAMNSDRFKIVTPNAIFILYHKPLRYDLTDTAGVPENKVLGMFHGLDD